MKTVKKKGHSCETCGKSFTISADLKKHVRTHTGERPFECDKCGARFTQCGGLKNHIASRHSNPAFLCHLCGKTFPVKERLRLHIRVHTGERPYQCKKCDKSFARGGQLAQHERTHTGSKPYRCTKCNAAFSCPTNLKIHMKRHRGERDHVCHECGKAFTRRDGLQKHLDCFHADLRQFRCKICNKDLKGHLLQHLRTHMNEKPYECDTCKASFAQRSQLTVHTRTHSGEKPYVCRFCKRAFAHSTALKLHERRHTGEKPFECPICPPTAFVQLPHLKKHMRCVHKTNKPYMCKSCRSFFATKNEFVAHGECGKSVMNPERMRELLTTLLRRISTPARLEVLGLGKRPIDEVLVESISGSGRKPVKDPDPAVALRRNVEILLEWTVPKRYMDKFKTEQRTVDDLLEELSS